MDRGDLRVEEIPHEVVLGEPLPSKNVEGPQERLVGCDRRPAWRPTLAVNGTVLAAFLGGQSRTRADLFRKGELFKLEKRRRGEILDQLETSISLWDNERGHMLPVSGGDRNASDCRHRVSIAFPAVDVRTPHSDKLADRPVQ